MRRYGRFLLVTILIAAGAWLSLPVFINYAQAWLKHLQTANIDNLAATASSSLAYPVKPKQWLKFALQEGSLQLRIITNAHIQRADAAALDSNWAYALHYELLDKNNVVLKAGVYHQHSRLTLYKAAEGGRVNGNYYLDPVTVPLDGRLILLGLQGIKGVAFLRIGLENNSPAVTEAAVRVYEPAKISDREVATSWLRMNQAQKDSLAKNSIYPSPLLSTAEQTNLLKHQWQPVGPMGVEGKDYQSLTLYSLKDLEQEPLDELMPASGLQADSDHVGVIPIPELGGQVSLTLKALDGSALTTPVSLNLQWFGRNAEQRWQQNTVWTKDSVNLDYPLDGGLLMIRPSSPVIVNAFLTTATEPKRDISDNLLSIKTYQTSVAIDFDVLHYQQRPAALRVDVRRLLTTPETLQRQTVRYQWLNADQQIIGSGELRALDQPSLFDRVGNIIDAENVSEPLSYYFNLPAQVSRLRLISNDPMLLVNAYNQPYGTTKTLRVPEDAYVGSDAQDRQLSWFPLSASNDDSLMQQQAVRWLSGQYRPPEDDAELLAGRYLWQDYIPEGEVSARYLLSDYTGEEPRADALASVYCSLPANRDAQVKFGALAGLRSISPELIFLRNNDGPFSAELSVNQQKAASMQSIGRIGIMRLPETSIGRHNIRLNTDSGGSWLMNYQAQCSGEQYLKRRVFALNAGAALDFIVEHAPEDEVFSARLYSPNNTIDRAKIKVDIRPLTSIATPPVSSNWTYQNRLYDIRPLSGKALPILYSQGQYLSNGERFSISLNSDLPAGRYHIRIASAKGEAGFVTLSQVKTGIHQQRRFYRESD